MLRWGQAQRATAGEALRHCARPELGLVSGEEGGGRGAERENCARLPNWTELPPMCAACTQIADGSKTIECDMAIAFRHASMS